MNKTVTIVIASVIGAFTLFVAGILLVVIIAAGANANQQRQHDKAKVVLDCVSDNLKSSTTRRCTANG